MVIVTERDLPLHLRRLALEVRCGSSIFASLNLARAFLSMKTA